MDERHPPRRILRSVGAVLAGFFATFILSIATDVVLHAIGVFPASGQPMSNALFVLATAYRTIYTVAGGYITARLAPDRPMAHVWALAIIGLVAGPCGHDGNLERRPRIRAEVVSPRAGRARVTFCLGGRQTCAARDSRELVSIASE
jgi:hypothetical protein